MVSRWLVRRFVPAGGDVSDPRVRERYGLLEGWVSVVLNLLISVVKLVPGLLLGSVSLVADAIHSASDVASSAIVIWGFKASSKPSDREHPFGHGRIESIASLVIAVLLLVAALEFGKAAVARLLDPQPVQAPPLVLVLLGLTIAAKEWMARFALHLGRTINSSALKADFWHHRSDALSTVIVLLALAGAELGVSWLDGAAGLAVSGFLAWAGVELVRESVDPLIGEAPSPAMIQQIRGLALEVPGVDKVHDIIVHHYGGLVVTSLHIEVSAALSAVEGHELAERVEETVMEALPGWATVHVDPVNRDHPLYDDVERFLEETVAAVPGAQSFHDLRIVGREAPCFVIFDLMADQRDASAAGSIRDAVLGRFPDVDKVVINVEPRYVY